MVPRLHRAELPLPCGVAVARRPHIPSVGFLRSVSTAQTVPSSSRSAHTAPPGPGLARRNLRSRTRHLRFTRDAETVRRSGPASWSTRTQVMSRPTIDSTTLRAARRLIPSQASGVAFGPGSGNWPIPLRLIPGRHPASRSQQAVRPADLHRVGLSPGSDPH